MVYSTYAREKLVPLGILLDHFYNSSWTLSCKTYIFLLFTFNYYYYMVSPVNSKLGTDTNYFVLQLIFSVPTKYFITVLFHFILLLLTFETVLLFILQVYLPLNFTIYMYLP